MSLCSREVVLTQGHDQSVDYWALGVLIYELLCGRTPFEDEEPQKTFKKIVNSQKHLAFPKKFDPHAKSLLRKLLHPNAALRLGSLQHGGQDVREHAFFTSQNIDFDKLLRQEVSMSYIPKVSEVHPEVAVELISLENEMNARVSDDYACYFGDLHLPQN